MINDGDDDNNFNDKDADDGATLYRWWWEQWLMKIAQMTIPLMTVTLMTITLITWWHDFDDGEDKNNADDSDTENCGDDNNTRDNDDDDAESTWALFRTALSQAEHGSGQR